MARRVRRRAADWASCDLIWAEELVAVRLLTRYQATALLAGQQPAETFPERATQRERCPLKIGPFVVLDCVGRSDLGATFRCRRLESRESLAIKRIDSRWTAEECVRAALTAESEKWAKLNDSRVVAVEQIHEEGGGVALVCTCVSGQSLSSWLRARRGVSPNAASDLIRQLISVLASADAHGWVHGDVKAANVLVDRRGQIHLTDCGTRRALPRAELLAERDLPAEQYDYVAPEVAAGELPPDATSDIYSIGCLLYHLLAGRPPYFAGNAARKLAAHRTGRLPDLRSLGVEVEPDVRLMLQSMLQPDRSRRVGSYNELLSRLSPVAGRSINRQRAVVRQGLRFGRSSAKPLGGVSPGRRADWSRWLIWAASSAATAVAVAHGGTRLMPLLSLRASTRSEAIVPDDRTSAKRPHPQSDRAVVSDLWNATEDLRRAYRDAVPHDTITLKSPGPFLLDAIEIRKPITLRGADDVRPLFVGGPGTTLRIAAADVQLENVHFLRVAQTVSEPNRTATAPLVEANATRLGLSHCSFQQLGGLSSEAILWNPAVSDDGLPATLEARHVLFRNVKSAVSVSGAGGRQLSLDNCLHLGSGPLVHSASGVGKPLEGMDVSLSHVTVYGAGAVVHSFPHPFDNAVPLRVVARDCFLLPLDRDQPMLAVHYAAQPAMLMPAVSWSGNGTVCPADATLLEVIRGPEAALWRATDFAAWQKYWGTHATGVVGVRMPFPEALPDTPAAVSLPRAASDSKLGANLSHLKYPPPVAIEQLPVLMERLRTE